MSIFLLSALALVGLVLTILIKSYRPEFGVLTSLGVVLFLLFFTLGQLPAVVEFFDEVGRLGDLPQDSLRILLKSLAICIVVQAACDTCSDYGQGAIAANVELAGKVLLFITALPLFTQMIELVRSLI